MGYTNLDTDDSDIWTIKISNPDNSIVYNYSNPITLTYDNVAPFDRDSPNGGEYWNQGTSHAITWLSNNFSGDVAIDLYDSGSFLQHIASNEPNDSVKEWDIPTDIPTSENYKVRIYDPENPSVYDEVMLYLGYTMILNII